MWKPDSYVMLTPTFAEHLPCIQHGILTSLFMHYLCLPIRLQEINNRFFFSMQPVFQKYCVVQLE